MLDAAPGPAGRPASFLDLTPADVEARLTTSLGEPRYRARQVLQEVYRRGARRFDAMTSLPGTLRLRLASEMPILLPEVADVQTSADGSRKFLLSLADGRR